eukprot:m.237550 g.237550  ORF g.237550 m.237550 type:complete len:81 (-) comp16057_c0_seq23:971-1213(-)
MHPPPLMYRSKFGIQKDSGKFCSFTGLPCFSTNMSISCTDWFIRTQMRCSADIAVTAHVLLVPTKILYYNSTIYSVGGIR